MSKELENLAKVEAALSAEKQDPSLTGPGLELADREQRFTELEIADKEQILAERSRYSKKILKMTSWWLASMIIITILQGFGVSLGFFSLSKTVLSILVGSTTLGILGIIKIIVQYLFKT